MRGRPAVRRCGYWKARGSWRASPGSGTTCADTAHGYIGAVTGGLGAAALYLSCTSGTPFVYFLYTCIHGCGLGRPARPVTSARWSALPVPDRMLPGVRSGPTSQPTSWSSANLMMNCAFGYIPVSSDQANAAWTPASSSSWRPVRATGTNVSAVAVDPRFICSIQPVTSASFGGGRWRRTPRSGRPGCGWAGWGCWSWPTRSVLGKTSSEGQRRCSKAARGSARAPSATASPVSTNWSRASRTRWPMPARLAAQWLDQRCLHTAGPQR